MQVLALLGRALVPPRTSIERAIASLKLEGHI